MPQKIRLTVSPQVRARMQRNQSYGADKTQQLSFYVTPEFAAKINQLAQKNKRSISSVLAEMAEFAMQSLDEGEAELEPTPSTMHPLPRTSPLSENDLAPGKQSKGKGVTLRMTVGAEQRPMTSAEIAEETLKRVGHEGIDVISDASYQRESSAQNGYRWHEFVEE